MLSFSRKRKKKYEAAAEEEEEQRIDSSTVKCALASTICPLYEKKVELLRLIKEDSLTFTKFQILYSYKIYAFYSHYLTKYSQDPEKFYTLYPKPEFSKLLSMCKSKSSKVPDEDSIFTPIENLDCKLRSFSLQYVRSQYETNFQQNFIQHSFSRLKRCVYNMPKFKTKKTKSEIHSELFASYYRGETSEIYSALLEQFPTLPPNGIRDLQKDPWRYIHSFFHLQNFLVDQKAKSFKLFPVASVERKHCVYDSRALHELARRLEPLKVASSWTKFNCKEENNVRRWWSRFFDLARFETRNKKFAGHLKTNGIVASFTFEVSKNCTKIKNKRSKESYDRIVAVDPGARIPLVCYEKKAADNRDLYSKYTAKNFFFDTREYKRKSYAKRHTEQLEKDFAEDVKLKKPNLKDCRLYAESMKFFEFWFTKRWKIYVENNKLVRNQTLDRYMRKEKAYEKIISKLFPKNNNKTLILYGKGSEFMNRSNYRLKGCAKFSHDSLLKKMKQKCNLSVNMVGEEYTSKTCAHCREASATAVAAASSSGAAPVANGEVKFVQMPKYGFKRHRNVFCRECRRNANRDYNGAKNIYLINIEEAVAVSAAAAGATSSIGSLVKTSSRYVPS